jgi:hypothetical protein
MTRPCFHLDNDPVDAVKPISGRHSSPGAREIASELDYLPAIRLWSWSYFAFTDQSIREARRSCFRTSCGVNTRLDHRYGGAITMSGTRTLLHDGNAATTL